MISVQSSLSCLEKTELALARIAKVDGDFHAFVETLPNLARIEAQKSDMRHADGCTIGPLDGEIFGVKDNLAVTGLPTRCGTLAFEAPAQADAVVVERVRAAGAIIIGTLNMHEGALGGTSDNPFWGRCTNPLKLGYTPGGSSGGSAAAIVGNLVSAALGTDTMGSVRIPAAYCGLWGIKPTNGRVPVMGLTHLSWTLDTIGPLARDPSMLGSILGVIEGSDHRDLQSSVLPRQMPNPTTLVGLRLGVPDPSILSECEDVVLDTFERLKTSLLDLGVILQPIKVAGWAPSLLRKAGLLISEAEGAEVFGDELEKPGLSEEFRTMLRYGRSVRAGVLAHAYRLLQQIAVSFDHSVQGVEGLLIPTAPQRAFPHESNVPVNQADFTALANAAGAPAMTFPLTSSDGGLPCAAQIIGHKWSDHRLIAIGKMLEELPCVSAAI